MHGDGHRPRPRARLLQRAEHRRCMMTGIGHCLAHVDCGAQGGGHRLRHRAGHHRRHGGRHRLWHRAVHRLLHGDRRCLLHRDGRRPLHRAVLRLPQHAGHRLRHRTEHRRRQSDGHRPRFRARLLQRAVHRLLHFTVRSNDDDDVDVHHPSPPAPRWRIQFFYNQGLPRRPAPPQHVQVEAARAGAGGGSLRPIIPNSRGGRWGSHPRQWR